MRPRFSFHLPSTFFNSQRTTQTTYMNMHGERFAPYEQWLCMEMHIMHIIRVVRTK